MIVGIDEVGRGCLAGPVCVGVVALDIKIKDLRDSKQISLEERVKLSRKIKQKAKVVSIGWASHKIVDEHGLTAALKIAALRALEPYNEVVTEILLDGNFNYLGDHRVKTIIGGDDSIYQISAASIVAKVARDNYMKKMHLCFPKYGFRTHVGYSTVFHKNALIKHGPTEIHRLSFAPLRTLSTEG